MKTLYKKTEEELRVTKIYKEGVHLSLNLISCNEKIQG